jgi:hypothetical protein
MYFELILKHHLVIGHWRQLQLRHPFYRKLRSLNFGECTVSVIHKAYSP